jgi:hypothetical protein
LNHAWVKNPLTRPLPLEPGIHLARAAIVDIIRRSEVVHLDIPQQPTSLRDDVPWEWFGNAQEDPTWGPLFEVIEQQREETRKAR